MEPVVLVAKIFLDGSNPLFILAENLDVWLEEEFAFAEADDIERYSVTFCQMTQGDLEKLPEHQGW